MKIRFGTNPGSRHMEIPVRVNEQGPFIFTMDTGATATTLTHSIVEKLGIKTRKESRRDWDAIGMPYEIATLDNLQIGSLDNLDEEVIVFDLESFLGDTGKRISGNIGHSTLRKYILSIDFESHLLDFSAGNGTKKNLSTWVDFNYVNNTHLIGVPTSFNGQDPINLVLDTGSPPTILTPSAAEKLGLSLTKSGPLVKGLHGTTQSYLASIDEIKVGEAQQGSQDILVLDLSTVSARGNDIPNGILGLSFLRNYQLTIDYPGNKITLN